MAAHVKEWNPRQRRLAQLLAEGWSKRDAYRESGYVGDHRAAWRACRDVKPLVDDLLGKVEAAWVGKQAVTREEVVQSLRDTRNMAKRQQAEKRHRSGCEKKTGCTCPMVTPRPDLASANKADELLGKTVGLFVDVQRSEDLEMLLDGMSDKEIDVFMQEKMQQFDPNYRRTLESRSEKKEEVEPQAPASSKLN